MTISADLLLNVYQSRAGVRPGAAAPAAKKVVPTAPWELGSKAPRPSELVKSVLEGRKFIRPDDVQLDLPGANQDYRKMFGLFQGLTALSALADQAAAKGVPATERERIQRRFEAGVKEVDAYVDGLKLDQLRLVRGEAMSTAKTGVGVRRGLPEYQTGVVHVGRPDEASPTFAGDVRFSIQADKAGVGVTTVNIDLADMGSEPRSLVNVLKHVNERLDAAGLTTRLAARQTPPEPPPAATGAPPLAAPDRWAIRVLGSDAERLTFSAPQAADAVYLAQTVGVTDSKAGTVASRQLLKFQTDQTTGGAPPAVVQPEREPNWVEGRAFARTLGPEVAAVRATAAGADGSVYVLGDITAKVDGQTIKGERDVALLKYDSAGKLLYVRTLGAAEDARGHALAVSADGKVAVAGSVTGGLAGAEPSPDPAKPDSFVTLFDEDGEELWTRRRGASAEDEARAVAFGADGTVYVGGRTRSAMPGGTAQGGWDGYLQSFAGADGSPRSSAQFGGVGEDGVTAIALDASGVVAAGTEAGHGVLRRFAVDGSGQLTAGTVRSLGDLGGGAIAAIAFDDAGSLVIAGSTRSGALAAGVANTQHSGERDGFVARLSAGLSTSAADRITYFGGAGEDTVTALAVRNNQVYVAGSSGGALPGSALMGKTDGFLVRMDAATGAVGWSRRFAGQDGQAAPSAIAVAAGGASILDRLGLPQGTLDHTPSKQVVAATAARPGDTFTLRIGAGGRGVQITIAAEDTLDTLAQKMTRALGLNARAEVVRDGDFQRIQIKPRNERVQVDILPGQGGRDALEALGLSEGVVRSGVQDKKAEKLYGLKLARDLDVSDEAAAKRAKAELAEAMTTIRGAFRDLKAALSPKSAQLVAGEAPAYLKNQLANYQSALARLGGG